MLDSLQPLSRDRFTMLLGNWYRINRGKFKVPIFAHQELDLHCVFWEVQARGGSDIVTAEKMWKASRPEDGIFEGLAALPSYCWAALITRHQAFQSTSGLSGCCDERI